MANLELLVAIMSGNVATWRQIWLAIGAVIGGIAVIGVRELVCEQHSRLQRRAACRTNSFLSCCVEEHDHNARAVLGPLGLSRYDSVAISAIIHKARPDRICCMRAVLCPRPPSPLEPCPQCTHGYGQQRPSSEWFLEFAFLLRVCERLVLDVS